MLLAVAFPVHASGVAGSASQSPSDDSIPEIVVISPPLFRDIRPERDLDERAIASYGVSTLDELLGEVAGELGDDDEPLILINGERVNDLADIGALPVETLRNVRVLPRGSAVRAGGRSGQRVVSLTLRRETRSATLTAAPKIATAGDWHGTRGEGILTHVRGSSRANLALRVRNDSSLLESDRDIIQTDPRLPFASGGNVIGFPNTSGEIDPLLSAAAGQIVTVAPVPGSASPTLADFIANANHAAFTDLGEFRTLRPSSRNYDFNGTYNTRLTSWLTGTASFRLGRNLSRSKRGLPNALFILSPDNLFSPFSTDVALAFYGQSPLHSRSRRDNGEASLTLNGRFGQWTSNFNVKHSESKDQTRSERQASLGPIPLADSFDPFGSNLSEMVPVRTDRATARSEANLAQLSFTGPAAQLPAGEVKTVIEGRFVENRLRSSSSFSVLNADRKFHRSEYSIRGAAEVPLTSREDDFLPEVGELSATAEYGRVHYSDAGTLNQHAFGLTWEPRPELRLRAEIEETGRPPSIQTLGNPAIVAPLVRVFDPLTGETVDVVQISGGNPSLRPQNTETRRLSGLLRLVPRLNLQLNAEYIDTDQRDFVSSLPEASAAVMLAFPDRFIRDSNGVLTTIDLRPVNFDSHRQKRMRYGVSLSTVLAGGPQSPARVSDTAADGPSDDELDRDSLPSAPVARARLGRAPPPTRLQFTANHSIVFSDEILIRPGLDSVDLLEGGAIGIAGGRLRHQLDGTAALTSGGMGVRAGVSWRGRSTLESRIGGTVDTLRFSPQLSVNLRAFADARRLFPRSTLARGMRLSLNVSNLTNDRQEVRDSVGNTPLQYQPGYRDPIGRTVELELRKVF